MTIKLEVGKRYELNNGEVHVCEEGGPMGVKINRLWYHGNGIAGCFESSSCHPLHVRRCLDDEPAATTWQDMARELIDAYRARFDACVADYALDDAMECLGAIKALEGFIGEEGDGRPN